MKTAKLVESIRSVPPEARRLIAAALVETEIQMLRQYSGHANVSDRRFYDGQASAYHLLAKLFSALEASEIPQDAVHLTTDET